jgi:protection-of-telomeres protein 1
MLKPEILRFEDGNESASPFTLRKYRANVRVVDYFPSRIEDFAVGRRGSEMDILSDYSGGEETDPEEERRLWKMGKGFAKNVWEWRFELLVEDANPDGNKEQIWLSVDDQAAQGLLNFDDEEKATR